MVAGSFSFGARNRLLRNLRVLPRPSDGMGAGTDALLSFEVGLLVRPKMTPTFRRLKSTDRRMLFPLTAESMFAMLRVDWADKGWEWASRKCCVDVVRYSMASREPTFAISMERLRNCKVKGGCQVKV